MTDVATAPTVLLVDDQPEVLRTLARYLEVKGFKVEIATSASDAVPALETQKVDAVVLDLRMPGESGLELLARMREHEQWRHVPAVILTGAALTKEEQATIARLQAYVFRKPKSYEALTTYLERALKPARG